MNTRTKQRGKAPSGRSYRLWADGDGIEVFQPDGVRIHDAGGAIPCIPLDDVPFVADMLRKHASTGRARSEETDG